MEKSSQTMIKVQKWVVFISIVLFALKIMAFYLTNSVAVLTDALESTVNVITGLTGLFALRVAAQPRDDDHPYGHGKAELISASLEGILIIVAGFVIVYESLINLQHGHTLQSLDAGMIIIGITAAINYGLGAWSIREGNLHHSIALQATGKHLQSDTWSTCGIIVGLLLVRLTGIAWIDSAVALFFAVWIITAGINIVRKTISGIMDEADNQVVEQLIILLNKRRSDNWIDLHNLRTIKFGTTLHVDCHLTVPWYFQVRQAHDEVDELEALIDQSFDHQIEMFVHLDPCSPPYSCQVCPLIQCPVREKPFEQRQIWTIENITKNTKHGL